MSLFQKYVVEDDYGAYDSSLMYGKFLFISFRVKKQEDMRNIGKKFWDASQSVYGLNTQAVIIISGNRANLGNILNANHEIEQLLGFKKIELVGENISILMPEVIGKQHNLILQKYFDKQHDLINVENQKDFLVFAQNTKGFIVPTLLFVRVIPNLDNGVQFLGFLSHPKDLDYLQAGDNPSTNDDVLLLMIDPSYKLIGFNLNVSKICSSDETNINIHKYLENSQKIVLSKIYPELLEEINVALLRSPTGASLPLNLMLLREALSNEIIDTYKDWELE